MATARVERRLAAILAADVVGYSRLMGEDEAGTLARLKQYRAIATRYDKRAVHFLRAIHLAAAVVWLN